ncbi:HNH endonuclease signature motif containing protein [Microbacterium pumilum]|uniref:DUF222 domain-containing protein n=1 Tax=Microbacterium pumilum TaxID=344165 RepID=A0ABP5E0R9_9MICO
MNIASTAWIDMEDPERFLDERDVLLPGEVPQRADEDVWSSGEAHSAAAAALEAVMVRARVLTAEQYAGLAAVLRDAAAHPDPWVGPDPTRQPDWVDPRDRSAGEVRRERRDIAVRAAAADLATRLQLSESMVRNRAAYAETLRERCPTVWANFSSGGVPEQNTVTAAQLASTLPRRDRDAWARFDAALADAARSLPPGKFRIRARVVRERVHPESIDDRHRGAAADRGVWLTPELDGMGTLTADLPADRAHAGLARVDAIARHLHAQDGEERTLAQLRADVLADLLAKGDTADSQGIRQRAAVAITVPALTLLGRDDTPATLEGYGPIDLETAKRLAGGASSWIRILTHPVTGTVLDIDRKAHRVPKALRRWLGVRDPVCVFPGCTRPARDCQIDHRLDWQYGGTTSDTNLPCRCAGSAPALRTREIGPRQFAVSAPSRRAADTTTAPLRDIRAIDRRRGCREQARMP